MLHLKRPLIFLFSPVLLLACSSNDGTATPASDAGYTGNQKDSSTTDSSIDSAVPDSSSKDGAADSKTADSAQPDIGIDSPESCIPDAIECKNNKKRLCAADGTWGASVDCGAQLCSSYLGCVNCIPGTGDCTDPTTARRCNDDGSGFSNFSCDPLVGSACSEGECSGPCAPQALGRTYIGCEYYPTVSINSQLGVGNFVVAVSNTTTDIATVTITQGATVVKTQAVPASSVSLIYLAWNDLKTSAATAVFANSAYRLRSTRPVTVYQFNPLEFEVNGGNTFTNDASLLLPVNAWGQEYVVAARNTWESANLPGFYSVVASVDGTVIDVTPSPTSSIRAGAGLAGNGAGKVTLNRGDVMQVLSAAGGGSDVTGTRIVSDKPVQVLGGHDCTNIPSNIKACDHIEEVMFPVKTLSTEYFVSAPALPGQTNPKAFFTRVIAIEAGTNLTYDPPNAVFPASIATAGSYIELDSGAAFQIKADKRILVSQYMKGQDAGGNSGDPAMALAVAKIQFRKDYLFHSPVNYTYNYVNITAPTGAVVNLDNAPVAGFVPIGGSGYSVARVQFANSGNGNHSASSDQQFGISVYGYGSYTSYWYPAGLNLTEY